MSETTAYRRIDSGKISSVNSDIGDALPSASESPCSSSPSNDWSIKFQTLPRKAVSTGIWDGYQTKEEFIMMHLR
ncbi:unnamed protein product [Rotaria magnacalcarata]|uniref:Uncharacterized protein n=1 Tax=Rotaria magnacalcarata TaxID=392030 RepID=A0A816YZI6_9BILA|nr:unnamed protein product [Rotaria magnacalcarata]CAF1664615.1 unnamed protein product [Rotaria magnacalcarata]CAF2062408.1 unnamed protein product [Rotaria magnacalcarata]CAF2182412.1 unnamed protein product [Rotaria magnacalcarata]CAF2245677.1 unnamed protein product [Rotaria magnacalcarata]